MIYVISDIHGCYKEFTELLQKIHFSKEDELYLLGDLMDRGAEPIKLVWDCMMRSNVYPILGNHDYIALKILKKLNVEITEENFESHLSPDDLTDFMYWMKDGGRVTVSQFRRLDPDSRTALLEYLEECTLYEKVSVTDHTYILVHAGIRNFDEKKQMDAYHFSDLIFERADYEKRYFQDPKTFLVTGHTPTFLIRPDGKNLIYEENGHIALDCGCVYGGKLAAYCLDNQKAYYVDAITHA